jgi:peroxiredoxin
MAVNLNPDGRKLYFVVLHVIIVAFAVQLFVLTKQNEQLKELHDPYWAGKIKVGDFFSVESLRAVTSREACPSEHNERQLILLFATKCRFCKGNIQSWQDIALKTSGKKLRVFGISLDSLTRTRSYVVDNRISQYDVFVPLNISVYAKRNRLGAVPLTLLRSQQGNVERVWEGSIDEKLASEILKGISD